MTDVLHTMSFGDQFPWMVKARHDGFRLYDPDFALYRDQAAYEKMLRDPIVRQALQIRYRTAAGGSWACVPADPENEPDAIAAGAMEALLGCIDGFQSDRMQMAQAILRGLSWAKIEGERLEKRIGDGTRREWWCPTKLLHYDKRFARHMPNPKSWDYDVEIFTRDGTWKRLPGRDFIRVAYEDDQGRFGYGRGLGEAIYFYWYAAMQTFEMGLQAVDRWAQGLVVGKIDVLNSIGDTTQTTASQASKLLDVINTMRAGNAIVHGKDDEIEVYDMPGSGASMALETCRFCYDNITRLVTGSRLPAGGGDSTAGSLARAEVEMSVSESIAQVDSEVLDDAITRDLVALLWELNAENFAAIGCADAELPRFKSLNEAKQDYGANTDIVVKLRQAGVPLIKREVYERVGFSPPGDDDELLEPMEPEIGPDGEPVGAGGKRGGSGGEQKGRDGAKETG